MIRKLKTIFILLFLPLFLLLACVKKEPKKKELHISGSIQIDPSFKNKTSKKDTIFLMAKPAPGGPPVAVQKLVGNDYPYTFHLTSQDLMTPESLLDVPLNLTVRVDKDGDAFTKGPRDLIGTYEKNPISLETSDIIITINETFQ